MFLNPDKCHSFLFSQYYHDPKPLITISGQVIHHGSKKDPTKLRILGVYFDRQLDFHHHLAHIQQQAGRQLSQFSQIANGTFGVSEYEMHLMYIAYICSVIEFAAPVWYPSMSKTSIQKLQQIQNKALHLAMGLPRSTWIDDLHAEANVIPLIVCFQTLTALHTEKY